MPLDALFMSANHIAAQSGGFEPQRQNNGLLFIEGLEEFQDNRQFGRSLITLSIESFPMVKVHNDPIELPYLNQSRKVPGAMVVDDPELVLRDFVDIPTLRIMLNWRNAVCDPITGRMGRAWRIKKLAHVVLLAPDGLTFRCFRLEGVWPSLVDPGDIDMNSSEKMLMNCQLCVDKSYSIDSGFDFGGAVLDWGAPISFLNQASTALNLAAGIGVGGAIGSNRA